MLLLGQSSTTIEGVLAASEKRQRELEGLLGRLREALERDTLGGAPGRAWVPFNEALEAHKRAWMAEAVMPDEVHARWDGDDDLDPDDDYDPDYQGLYDKHRPKTEY
jgi:hypothetical protein